MRGTSYLSAWRQTVSDWGSTPSLPSNTATAPSRTRSERSTSTVKSTWPGVSMMLIWVSCQWQGAAAGGMVSTRPCSSSLQSPSADRGCGPCRRMSRAWCWGGLPAVVGEGLVGLGHLVRVLATLHRGTEAVARVEDLVHEALGHGLLAAVGGVADE